MHDSFGNVQIGTFKNGKGQGMMILHTSYDPKDDSIYVFQNHQGKRNGKGTIYDSNGNIFNYFFLTGSKKEDTLITETPKKAYFSKPPYLNPNQKQESSSHQESLG